MVFSDQWVISPTYEWGIHWGYNPTYTWVYQGYNLFTYKWGIHWGDITH